MKASICNKTKNYCFSKTFSFVFEFDETYVQRERRVAAPLCSKQLGSWIFAFFQPCGWHH